MQQAIVFGLGSMFNHSRLAQNVAWTRDLEREVVVYTAIRNIPVGEELCISYGAKLWFEDADDERNFEHDDDLLHVNLVDSDEGSS